MDRILIHGLRVRTILGVPEQERVYPQEVWIDLTLEIDTRPAAEADDVSLSVDYAEVAQAVRARVEAARWRTVEALAEDVAHLCLRQPRLQKVIVRVQKPHAVSGVASVGVEIERTPA
jgi:dihydroneopterin aldolase